MSTRWTLDLRNKAASAMLDHAMNDRAVAFVGRQRGVVERVLTECLGKGYEAKIAALPENWLPVITNIVVNANGWRVSLPAPSIDSPVEATFVSGLLDKNTGRRLPAYMLNSIPSAIVGDLGHAVQALVTDRQALFKERDDLKRIIFGAIKTYSTVEKMIAAEPDLEPIIGHLRVGKTSKPLALTAQKLMCSLAQARGEERAGCAELGREAA